MITVITYLIMTLVLLPIGLRSYAAARDGNKVNEFHKFFSYGVLTMAAGQIINLLLIACFWVISPNPTWLFWSDVVGRLFLYLGAAFIVQMSLLVVMPKLKNRIYISYLVALYGVFVAIYNLTLNYAPVMNQEGIIEWNSPVGLALIFGIPIMLIWLSCVSVFFYAYYKSKFESLKLLFLSLGFFVVSVAGFAQDYGKTALQFFLINSLMIVGFVLVFVSLMVKDRQRVSS